ncbi:MAG TPA: hypothetical protein VMX35_09015 [Acidobacteriota bacterium]|nr:hypothetical protein [Acidobacteriota bacterium]
MEWERISVIVDMTETFVDPDGSFYCGTTPQEKENAAAIARLADWNLSCPDLHPMTSLEFEINGGLYPIHSVPRPEAIDLKKYGLQGKSIRPRLTRVLHDAIDRSRAGVYVPRQVYFQEPDGSLSYSPADVEVTFGLPIITAERFLAEDFTYLIQPKYFFDATRLSAGASSRRTTGEPRIPEVNENVFSLIKRKYRSDAGLAFFVPSVVENICTHHTAAGIRMEFPNARVIVPTDATTPLAGVGLGFERAADVAAACRGLALDIGIEYKSTAEIVSEFSR